MGKKQVMFVGKGYEELDKYLAVNSVHRLFLVCGASICRLTLHQYFETLKARMGIDVVRYSDFGQNPLYESVVEGVRAFRSTDSDLLAAVGGGSAMDMAKCIKLFSNMDAERNFLEQPIILNDVRLLAIPTTAGHAMCYKLTGLYGIAHGHAAALCLSELWPFMLRNLKLCVDPRGEGYLEGIFSAIAVSMGCKNQWEAVTVYRNLLNELSLTSPKVKQADFDVLKYSVNAVRLKNNPIALSPEAVDYLYHEILE